MVGDVVIMLAEHKNAPLQLGRIIRLTTGKDGEDRIARLKTKSGETYRPISKLAFLESCQEEILLPEVIETADCDPAMESLDVLQVDRVDPIASAILEVDEGDIDPTSEIAIQRASSSPTQVGSEFSVLKKNTVVRSDPSSKKRTVQSTKPKLSVLKKNTVVHLDSDDK
jgi:hypothetical protein